MATKNVRKRNPVAANDGRRRENKAQGISRTSANVQESPKLGPQLLKPLPWQRALLATPDNIGVIVLAGGRGGGKSTALVLYILKEVLRYGPAFRGVLLRRDMAGLKRLTAQIEQQAGVIPQLAGTAYKVGEKTFEFSNGAVLQCGYIKDERSFGKYQGDSLTFLGVDEAAQLPEPDPLLRLMSSMRTTDVGVTPKVLLTCNPNNVGSWWVYEHVISKLVSFQAKHVELFEKRCLLAHSTLFDNEYLVDPDSYVQTLKASCNGDEAKIASEVFGSWSAISGTFFSHTFSQTRSLIELPDRLSQIWKLDPKHVWLGMDWGTRSPASCLLMFRTPEQMQVGNRLVGAGSVVVVDEIYTCTKTADGQRLWNTGDRSLTVGFFAEMVRAMCERNGIGLHKIRRMHRIADAAVGAEIGSDHGSIGKQLKKAGAEFVAGPKARRADGWQRIATLLDGAGDPYAPGLYFTGRCDSIWSLFPKLTYCEKNPEDIDTTQPDHSADALRYAITAMDDPRYRANNGTSGFRVW